MRELSVVLPTYNIEKYVSETIESILNQTYKDLELIIIDDNSTDGTRTILKKYAAIDNRVKLIFNEKNVGPGAARNLGIQKATGYYLTFMDHDDWQDLDRYKKMIYQLEKDDSDVCFSYAQEYYQDLKKYITIPYPKYSTGAINFVSQKNNFKSSFFPPWAKVYKIDFVKNFGLKFTEGSSVFDDVLFHSLLLLHLKNASVYEKVSYTHRVFERSISYNFYSDIDFRVRDYLKSFDQAMQKCILSKKEKQEILKYYLELCRGNVATFDDLCELAQRNELSIPLYYYLKVLGKKLAAQINFILSNFYK